MGLYSCIDATMNSFIFGEEISCFPDCSETYKIKKSKKSKNNSDEISKKGENSEFNINKETENKQNNSIKNEDELDISLALMV